MREVGRWKLLVLVIRTVRSTGLIFLEKFNNLHISRKWDQTQTLNGKKATSQVEMALIISVLTHILEESQSFSERVLVLASEALAVGRERLKGFSLWAPELWSGTLFLAPLFSVTAGVKDGFGKVTIISLHSHKSLETVPIGAGM